MLRLASSAPPLWRTSSSLQLGADARVRLDTVEPWQERLLAVLTAGAPDAMLLALAPDLGTSPDRVRAFVDDIAPALDPPPPPRPAFAVEYADGVAEEDRGALAAAFAAAGVSETAPDDRGATRVLVASRLVEPRRAAALVAADIRHLPVELSGDRAQIGPVVIPGVTGCLACAHAHRTASDEAWPTVAAQLLARRSDPTQPAILLETAASVLRLLSAPESEAARSVTLHARNAHRDWVDHRPHPDCWCRDPGRSETPAGRGDRRSAPTTATGYERPA